MTTHLSEQSLKRAIDHLWKYGDTDVFPHMLELVFLHECKDEVIKELSGLDLDRFLPSQAIGVLSPKSRYGFRVVHQQQLLDAVLFTAACIEIAADLEKLKQPLEGMGPFAYRFDGADTASLFISDHNYRDWLEYQKRKFSEGMYTHVVFTDIADFYQRIYLHRLENVLDSATSKKGVREFIERVIKTIRSKQSYGIPVGGSASRILAEAMLCDSDAAILSEEISFSRYVDDFRLFLTEEQEPYQALSFLAEQLFLTEGLTLNGQKTKVLNAEQFASYLSVELPDKSEEAKNRALSLLSSLQYFEEELEGDLVDQLKSINLVQMLEESIKEDNWEFGEIKALFRAIRIVPSDDATEFLISNFEALLSFSKEMLLYFDAARPGEKLQSRLQSAVEVALASQSAKSVPSIHAWLLEFNVRSIVKFSAKKLDAIAINNPLCDRQMALIHGVNGNANYFRRLKTSFDGMSGFAKWAFMMGASCLPKDEFDVWVEAVRPRIAQPLSGAFCKWIKLKSQKLDEVVTLSRKREEADV